MTDLTELNWFGIRAGFRVTWEVAVTVESEAGRNHLLATYFIMGFVASLAYAVS